MVTVVGAGITLAQAMEAADTLAAAGINIRVVDPFTIKPIDRATLLECARATGGRVITVEDHYPEGQYIGYLVRNQDSLGFPMVSVYHSSLHYELLQKHLYWIAL